MKRLLKKWFGSETKRSGKQVPFKPRLEALEDRMVPAIVSNLWIDDAFLVDTSGNRVDSPAIGQVVRVKVEYKMDAIPGNPAPVTISVTVDGQTQTLTRDIDPQDRITEWSRTFDQFLVRPGTHQIDVMIDPDDEYTETDATDNAARFSFTRDAGTLGELSSLPLLESNAGAAVSLYLDFNGHFEPRYAQYQGHQRPDGTFEGIQSPVFDMDFDPTTFSTAELAMIREIWARVAEDFAPFNINVTTDFSKFTPGAGNGLRVAIGGSNQDWVDNAAWWGVTLNSPFTNASMPQVVYAFSGDIVESAYWQGKAHLIGRWIADTASHEAGHGFGLGHQSSFNAGGNLVDEYSTNNHSSLKAPIMGNSMDAERSTWWKGPTKDGGPASVQEDMAVIGATLGFRTDDHPDMIPTSIGNGIVGGIIEHKTDLDVFQFTLNYGGWVNIEVDVASIGANLDARFWLVDSAHQLLAVVDPGDSLGGSLFVDLAAGTYFVTVSSQGATGDVGQYSLNVGLPLIELIGPKPGPMEEKEEGGFAIDKIPLPPLSLLGEMKVGQNASGRSEAFAIGKDNQLWHTLQLEDGTWTSWESLKGPGIQEIALLTNAEGLFELYALGMDKQLYRISQTSKEGWSDWEQVDPTALEKISPELITDEWLMALAKEAAGGGDAEGE